MLELLKNMNWRYATKSFDTSKKVSESDLSEIIEVFRLTPSSFGLEPWKLIIVENPETREKLKIHSCSKMISLDDFLNNNSKITGATREQLSSYENMMKGYFSNLSIDSKSSWARDQVFLALGNVMNFLAQKHIDSCAIGGFDPAKYDEVLELDKLGLSSVVVLPIGYRSENDKNSLRPKVRFSKEEIIIKK